MSPFVRLLESLRGEIDDALDRFLPKAALAPVRLHEAMRYAVFAGGKRLRPALVVLSGERFGAPRRQLLAGAAAIEMIHTYSLVHDDLPALDDDDLRRGRPTVHRQYDEATAILVGDALLTRGLTLLAAEPSDLDGDIRRRAAQLVGEAIGTAGMIGGQVEDLESERVWPADPETVLESIHRRKTGALLVASLRVGGIYAGASEDEDQLLELFGRHVGLLFQIADDLLDVEGSAESLGKTPGKDARRKKLTYPELYGVADTRRRLNQLAEEARADAQRLGAGPLADLVEYLLRRDT